MLVAVRLSARISVGETPRIVTRSLDEPPEPAGVGIVGSALEEHERAAERLPPTTSHGPMIQPMSVTQWSTSPGCASVW